MADSLAIAAVPQTLLQLPGSQSEQEGHNGHVEAHVPNPSEWWAGRRSLGCPTRVHNKSNWFNQQQQVCHGPSRPSCKGLFDDDLYIQTLCEEGHLDRALHALYGMLAAPSSYTYISLLKACNKQKSLPHAKHIHAHLALHQMDPPTGLLGDYLVVSLAKCGAIKYALHVFHALPCRTVFSWTAMISAYTECGRGREAIKMHVYMQEDGVEPDNYTFVSLFKACGSIPDLSEGRKLHALARSKGFNVSDIFIGTTLVSMYGKCGSVMEAENVFGGLYKHNFASWMAMISVYDEHGQGEKILRLYRQMQGREVIMNSQMFVIALQACGSLVEKEETPGWNRPCVEAMSFAIGQALHAEAWRKGFASDVFVCTTLVNMYSKCGSLMEAENVFHGLSQGNVVSWTAMISAYVEHGQGEKALQLYRRMQEEGESPDQLTFVISLQACGTLAEKEDTTLVDGKPIKLIPLKIGSALHHDAHRKGFDSNLLVSNTLIHMYGKCGNIVEARNVFDGLSKRDIVSWNVMLSAYVEQSHREKALQLYRRMQREPVSLDDVTLLCVLQVCNEPESLEMCKQIHFTIVCAGYDRDLSLANTLIHTYGTCASMVDAQAIFHGLLHPDVVAWNACIAGHAGEGNSAASLEMFEEMKLASIKPDGLTFTAVLSSCSHAGLVVEGLDYFESMCRNYGIAPDLKHYGSMIDLFGRAGDFKRVDNMLGRMPMQADLTIWLCLLSACRVHDNLELGQKVLNYAVKLKVADAG